MSRFDHTPSALAFVAAVVADPLLAEHLAPELAETDRQRITVARYADEIQIAVGAVSACCDRWHTAVSRVKTVRIAQEIGRRLR